MATTKAQREVEARVNTDLEALETDRAAARKFFRWWLGGATLLTLIGNAAHAVIPMTAPTWVRIAVHLVPPLIALVAIHGVTVLARTGAVHRADRMRLRDAGGTTTFAVASAGALALAAAVLSYAGLRGLAESAGMHGWLAVLFPLTIDLGIAVSSVALVVLRPASAADLRTARAAHVEAPTPRADDPAPAASPQRTSAPPQVNAPAAPVQRVSAPTVTAPTPRPAAPPQRTTAPTLDAPVPAPAHREAAERIAASGVTAKGADEVAVVLAARDAGHSARRIAETTGLNGRTVRKLIAAADELTQPESDDQPAEPSRVLTAV